MKKVNYNEDPNLHIGLYLKNHYLKLDKPNFAVLINGKWGSGKTYYINKLIEKWSQLNSHSDQNSIEIKPIYVSLNGVSEISFVNQLIREKISPFLYSKGMKIFKQIVKGTLAATTRINFDLDNGLPSGNVAIKLDEFIIFDSNNEHIKGEKILIFDDLERCKIPIDEIFGFVNNFTEHLGCKVIIICDETKIIEKHHYTFNEANISNDNNVLELNYKHFKEKLIGKTFLFQPNHKTALKNFIEHTKIPEINYLPFQQIIVDLFEASETENLRSLQSMLYDFSNFLSLIDQSLKRHRNYNDFINSLFPYFIIMHLEFKNGNTKPYVLNQFTIPKSKENKINSQLQKKYNAVLENYKLHLSDFVINLNLIVEYINMGYISIQKLNNHLLTNVFFKEENVSDWMKLYRWNQLTDKELKSLKNSIIKKFISNEINDIFIFVHVVGILINLINEELLNTKVEKVIELAEINLEYIYNLDPLFAKSITYSDPEYSSYNMKFQSSENLNMKNFLLKYKDYIKKSHEQIDEIFIKNIFDEFDEKKLNSLNDLLNRENSNKSLFYYQTAIFSKVDGTKFAKTILTFENRNLALFHQFILKRYPSTNNIQEFKDDLQCLEKIYQTISSERETNNFTIKSKFEKQILQELKRVINTLNIRDKENNT